MAPTKAQIHRSTYELILFVTSVLLGNFQQAIHIIFLTAFSLNLNRGVRDAEVMF